MREILVRGKRVDNGEWVYGYYWSNDLGNHFIRATKRNSEFILKDYEVDENTIGQFTGLLDKNGKKIFEDDIILFNKGRNLPNYRIIPYSVKWNERDCSFQRYPYGNSVTISGGGKLLQVDMMSECEIIGNIYDNPELLNEV